VIENMCLTEQIAFNIRIAGLCFGVSCRYPATKWLCRDYVTDCAAAVQEHIRITSGDIEGERQRLLRKKNPGETLEASTPEVLECLHLCRRIAELLPKYDRVLFHGSVLAIDGRGVLFTAKSGTGKSTHTRLWRQEFADRVRMVNDDKPFLHITGQGVTVYGTPWQGKHGLGENISAPLDAVCYLNRGTENRISAVSPRELFPVLLQQTYTPDDPEMMVRTLALVEKLSHQTRLLKLYCNMDPEAAHVALAGIDL